MRVMLDTNVLISALLFPNSKMDELMECVFTRHRLVLSSYVLDELRRVVKRKFPKKEADTDKFIRMMSFERVRAPEDSGSGLFEIRDGNDYPVLLSAIAGNVDVLVTGDKDFADVKIKRPRIMTPAEFMTEFL